MFGITRLTNNSSARITSCCTRTQLRVIPLRPRLEITMKSEVEKFRLWALGYPECHRSGEWECDYENWGDLHKAVLDFLASTQYQNWNRAEIEDLIYAIARDNEIEYLVDELSEVPERLLFLSSYALTSEEPDAKWQLAMKLGDLVEFKDKAEELLVKFVEDENEYVSRRALLSLGRLKSSFAESLAERAWNTGHEYQRIAAMWVLKYVNSEKLASYLEKAEEDGRFYVLQNANEIKKA